MDIYDKSGRKITIGVMEELPITKDCEHEEELMKSDFVKLSWNDTDNRTIPVDSYIIPYEDGVKYSLLEPYYPEQKSEIEYRYEPEFQHPKMIYSKVTFKRPSKDSEANDITLLDWSYVGDIYTLLQYFCDQMNEVYGFSGAEEIGFQVIGELNINIANISFQTQDILSALTNLANQCECEWHLDWSMRTLYFGRILFHRTGMVPQLIVGGNITTPSVRNSKDGYWNAFEPQGSTRNITRRAASGEYVLANIRLSLRGDDYPDGIVYTDGKGNIISKSDFERRGERAFVKSLIFEDVFPKLDLYVYNVRYRERYLLEDPEDPESKVISYYDASGKPVYKRYSVWYMNLAYPTYDVNGHVTRWTDYDISEVRNYDVAIKRIISNDLDYHYLEIELDLRVSASWFTNESTQWPNSYIVELSCNGHEVKGYVNGYYFSEDGSCRFYSEYSDTGSDERDETSLERITAFQNAISEGGMVTFVSGMNREKFPKYYSQIIDGKSLYGQFKVNTSEDALSSPLAGRGDGDNGNYGFEMVYLGIEGKEYIDDANTEPTDDGDTGIVDMKGNRALATEKDYEIVFQQSGDYILPTTLSQLIIPKGGMDGKEYITDLQGLEDKDKGLTGNIVNLYNIVMTPAYEESAKTDLENRTKKYIALSVEDNNSYSFKSDPISFSERFHTPLYIGEKVDYIDGSTYTALNPLSTRVMKLVTKLDYSFEQEITIGNEVLKGSQQTLKEQVQSMVSYGASGGGGGGGTGEGGGMSESAMRQLLKNEGAEFFLSKKYDDQAVGAIGFMKGIWFGIKDWFIDNTGSANLFNATINGLLTAYNAVINTVKSSNYSGDGMLDTGWRITNDYQGGNSKATFDFLYIRKKALFEELEIRKLSHIGGNFCLSGASGRVWRVEYFDKDGKPLGYDVKLVPWTFKGMVLMLFAKNKLNKYWGREKLIERKLTDEERSKVRTIRVYMFTDDGSTETMLNWTVGAQARCQSFNITKQMEFDGSSWKGLKVGNTYWYRLVTATGDKVMDDGNTHQYVEFRVDPTKEGTAYEWADAGSDFPSVGDAFVQMGHRTREDQSNVIMLETANEDSPAIKMYAGVNWWTVSENQLVATMSPKGWKVSAESFEWMTRYGERFHQTINRGVWVLIPLDEDGERKCYFNDMVSHNGCYWRCIVAQGSYTTDEPSESSSAWSKEVYAGIAPYLTLSDQMLGIPCEKDGKATTSYGKAITVKLMVTNLEATITNLTLTGGDSHVEKTAYNKIAVTYSSGSAVTNKDYTITVEGDLNGNHYVATDKISVYAVIRGNDAYEVTCTPEVFIWSQQETEPYAINIDKTSTGNSSLGVAVKNDGVDQPFQITSVTVVGKNASGTATSVAAQYDNNTKRVWVKSIANDTLTGQLTINVKYGNNAVQSLVVPFYCNLIGTWQEKVVGDTKTEVAQRMKFDICDETGKVIGTTTLANYVKSSSGSTASLQKQTAALSVEDERLKTELGTTKRSLEKSIDDTETELNAAITAGDSALSTSIANAKAELKGDVNTVSTSLATYEQTNDRAVQALGTRVSNSETSITNTNTRVSTAEGSIQTISSTVTTQGNSISGLNKRMGAAETSITNTNTRVSTAEGNINTVKHDLYDSTGLLKSNYSTTTQTATMIQNEVASKTKGMVTTSTFKQTAESFSLCTTTQASGYANTAEGNAKNAAQGYANTAYGNAKYYADGVGNGVESKLKETGIIIDGSNREVKLIAGKVSFCDSSGTKKSYVQITNDGKIKATDGEFSGKVTASSGSIGGFTISTDRLYNSNWNAGVDISYDSKTVKIGKNAAGTVNTEQAIIRAENTKSNQTYNTALYLNAQKATYNYAFYGNGNGVLNGIIFGYKVNAFSVAGSSDATYYLDLKEGATVIFTGSRSAGTAKVYVPKISDIRKALGITSTSVKFAFEYALSNQTSGSGTVKLIFRSYPSGNSEYPYRTNFDNNYTGNSYEIPMATGDYCKILLIWDGSSYKAFVIRYIDGGWGV